MFPTSIIWASQSFSLQFSLRNNKFDYSHHKLILPCQAMQLQELPLLYLTNKESLHCGAEKHRQIHFDQKKLCTKCTTNRIFQF